MTGHRFKYKNSRDIPRFSPNFSVYVLPPDVVCLYSEDRKFFLHGDVYCAVASAIGNGGKSFAEIFRKLAPHFSPDQIEEALKRLVDRRHVVAGSRSRPRPAAAYWASLGLDPAAAEANLRNCGVRIEALDVAGAAALERALRGLGVRLVKRSPGLTVTLVGDYLDDRLAASNRKHLSEGSAWLLVQPSGIFPLVGPVLRPGHGACWTCLADRMRRNREVKAMLDRGPARRVAQSPLARDAVGQSGVELAAVEIAKAIASAFRTPLNDHIVSLDLLGATIAKHYVARRPQCPSCGRADLRDPGRAPTAVALGAGSKLLMTSGGYRSVSSGATVARFRRHVSPLTGVVSRLERIDADLPLNTNYFAAHNFSAPARTIHELRAGLQSGSYGKGSTAEQGEASALMEAIERYCGMFQGDEIRLTRRLDDFPAGAAIFPNDVLLFSETQLQANDPNEPPPWTPPLFDPAAEIEWSPVWSVRDGRFRYLPTSVLYFFYQGFGEYAADSNGCAAGNTFEEAIVQGFLELVERDAYAIWWYNRLQRAQVDLSHCDDGYVRDLQTQLADTGRRLWVLDITTDLGIPCYVAIAHWVQDSKENIEFGSGAHFDSRIALLRALTELNQFLSIGLMGGGTGEKSSLDGDTPLRLREHPYLMPSKSPPLVLETSAKFGRLDAGEQAKACVAVAARMGLDFLVLDQTRPDIEVPVARVVVPGLRHFYRRFAPGRLYDVPVKLGLRERATPEAELNPIHPHT